MRNKPFLSTLKLTAKKIRAAGNNRYEPIK